MGSKKSLYAMLATFTNFYGKVPGFGNCVNHSKSNDKLELGKGMSSEEMGTKGKKKLPKSKRNKHKCYKTKNKTKPLRNKIPCNFNIWEYYK